MTQEISIQALTYDAVSQEVNGYNEDGVLRPEEEREIARIVNRAINIPFMSESREERLFLAGIRLIDKALAKLLPKDLLDSIHDLKGVSNEEVEGLERRMTPIINRMINIPVVPEFLEARLISLVLGIILNALRDGSKVPSEKK